MDKPRYKEWRSLRELGVSILVFVLLDMMIERGMERIAASAEETN